MFAATGQRGGGMTAAPSRPEPHPAPPRPSRAPSARRRRCCVVRELGIVARPGRCWSRSRRPVNPRFLSGAERPRHPAQHLDPRGAGRRPADRGHHPQHRPVGRLGARPVARSPPARLMQRRPGPADGRSRSSSALARRRGVRRWSTACSSPSAGCPRWSSRSARSTSSAASTTRGPRGQQINAAEMPAALPDASAPHAVLGVPLLVADRAGRGRWRRRLLPAQLPDRPRALRDRLRARRPPGWPASRSARSLLGAFVLSGALAGLAGVLFAARFGTVDADRRHRAGAATSSPPCVVGGVAIFGGSGTVCGAALGALLLTAIGSALPVLGINQFWQQAIVGALILAAIALDRALVGRGIARRLRKRNSHV